MSSVRDVHSVCIVLDRNTGRAENKGKQSLYRELYTAGTAYVYFDMFGPTAADERIDVSFVDHGTNRDVYFGTSGRLGDVALKVHPVQYQGNENEKNLVNNGFKPFAVTV